MTKCMSLLLMLAVACDAEVPVIEGDHLDDYEAPTTAGCPALGIASVTASGDDGHVAANAVDHDPATRWSALGKGSWLQVDLGEVRTVCSAGVAWYRGDQRRSQFSIAVSTDGTTF